MGNCLTALRRDSRHKETSCSKCSSSLCKKKKQEEVENYLGSVTGGGGPIRNGTIPEVVGLIRLIEFVE